MGRIDPDITTRKRVEHKTLTREEDMKVVSTRRCKKKKKRNGEIRPLRENIENARTAPQNGRKISVSKALSHADVRFACAWRGKKEGKISAMGP
jgi:hypothetical protein